MSERAPQPPDWRTITLDYFLSHEPERRAEYEARGLGYTNNLSLYINDNPDPEIAPGTGIRNPFDYRQQPFGPMIERLHAEHPELWERAKQLAASQSDRSTQLWDLLQAQGSDSAEVTEFIAASDALWWQKAEAYTEVMDILAPWLLEAGVDPLELCK